MGKFDKLINLVHLKDWDEDTYGEISEISTAESIFWLTFLGDFILFGDQENGKSIMEREDEEKLPSWMLSTYLLDIPDEISGFYESIISMVNPDFYSRFGLLNKKTQEIVIEWRKAITNDTREEAIEEVSELIEKQSNRLCMGLISIGVGFYNPTYYADLQGRLYSPSGLLGLGKKYYSANEMLSMFKKYNTESKILENLYTAGRRRVGLLRALPILNKYSKKETNDHINLNTSESIT